MKKRLFAVLASLCMVVSMVPTMAFAQDSGTTIGVSDLCEHHTEHTSDCGYTEGPPEQPCAHEHTDECYAIAGQCVHTAHDESCGGLADPTACTHVCGEDTGCVIKTLNCQHQHNESCGYVPAAEGTPCTFVCEVCSAQDSGNPGAPSDAQPEECTCETLCTGEEINGDCPVCSAEGAELDKVCVGAALLLTAPTLRTGEIELYVGGQRITESGCYENKSGTWRKVEDSDGTEPANGQFSYDADSVTLTLNKAEITNNQTVNVAEGYTYDGSVIAFSQTADVSLNIVVSQGTSTITGKGGIRVESTTGNASLSIKGSGSLDVEPKGSNSGITLCSSKNTNLDIDGADVTASSPSLYGVYLLSDTATSTSTITVNNGSLTTGGNGNVGIYYYWSGTSNAGTSSLTVSGNAVVDTRNSQIMAQNKETVVQVGAGSDGNGGIVFNGKSGTVYGKVELQDDLTINEGETLTVGKDASLTVPENVELTNKGKINNSGKLTGIIEGNQPPKITTTSLSEGTVNTAYNQPLAADNNPTSWSVTNGTLPDGLTLNSDGTITGTPTAAGASTFTVTATNDSGSDSKVYTLTINPAPILVTGVTLKPTSLSLFTGDTATLTATVEPSNATNKNVTWESSNKSVATVDANGLVTAVSAGTATITVTTEDGTKTATCAVTVKAATVSVTGVTLSQTQASLYSNHTPSTLTLTATVAPDDATNKAVTWTSSNNAVATVDANGLITAVAPGTATITVTTVDGSFTATCTVTVSRHSSGGGSSSRPTPSLSDQAIDNIRDARPGDTVEITLRPGRTTLEREVFESLAGQNITLEIDAGDGVLWTVNGLDIPEDTRLHDLDLDVDLGDSDIPARVINAVTGTVDTVQLSLKHDGEFGFTMALSAPLGRENADLWANLYWYNERSEELEFQQAVQIERDGTAEFALDHASDYAIVIDTDSHEPVELPFRDVPENAWYADAAAYVYRHGLMAGTSATTFAPEVTTSRAMIVNILWRLAGSPQVDYLMEYSDVDPTAYYGEAIRWATSEGIVGGYGGGVFGPDDPITREQLATMLWRYAQHEGYDVGVGEDTNILSYTDAFDVAEYAIPAMQWACGSGVINGTGDGSTLSPQGEATRAQVAVMLQRFCELNK